MLANIIFKDNTSISLDIDREKLTEFFECVDNGEYFFTDDVGKGIWLPKCSIKYVWLEEQEKKAPLPNKEDKSEQTKKEQWRELAEKGMKELMANQKQDAPWGYKKDGTPRKRPGRQPKKTHVGYSEIK